MIPKILTEVVTALKDHKIEISEKVEGEGRGGSLKDEGTIKKYLMDVFGTDVIMDVTARRAGDILVKDYDGTIHPVNIKTSLGGTDNATSMVGFLYALTDIPYEELPSSINKNKFVELVDRHRKDISNRDYWYLCVSKTNSGEVMIRGAKQINCWVENANPANLLQINWKKEKTLPLLNQTYDEAYDKIVGGIKRCIIKSVLNLHSSWQEDIVNAINTQK
jgi:hypothetical protein